MRMIPRAQLLDALEKFGGLGRECGEDELNVDLFRLFDDSEARVARPDQVERSRPWR